MDSLSFTIDVEELNYNGKIPRIGNQISLNIHANTLVGDVKDFIWVNKNIKPSLQQFQSQGRSLLDLEKISDKKEVLLVIDYLNWEISDPVLPLFDVSLSWKDLSGASQRLDVRESLNCKIKTLKEYINSEQSRPITHSLSLESFEIDGFEANSTLSQVLQLDVIPHNVVHLHATSNNYQESPTQNANLVARDENEYQVTLTVDNEVKKVSLSTSQCIVVDNGEHQPYLLLNNTAYTKLSSVFTSSSGPLVQKANVVPLEEPMEEQPQVDDDILIRLYNTGRTFGVLALKIAFFLTLLGFKPTQSMMDNWLKYLLFAVVGFNFYVVFFTGRNRLQAFLNDDVEHLAPFPRLVASVARQTRSIVRTINSTIIDELINLAVQRTYDFDLIISKETQWIKWFSYNIENLWKDTLISILMLFPSAQIRIFDAIEKWKNAEIEFIISKAFRLQELNNALLSDYNKDWSFDIPESNLLSRLNDFENTTEMNEKKFDILVLYYQYLLASYEVINKGFITKKEIPQGQRDMLIDKWNLVLQSL